MVVGLVVVYIVVVVLSLMTHSPDRQIQSFRTAQSTGSISWQSLAFSQTSGPDVVVTTGVVVTSSSIHSP